MDFAQLLDPKGAAKAKEKSKKRPLSHGMSLYVHFSQQMYAPSILFYDVAHVHMWLIVGARLQLTFLYLLIPPTRSKKSSFLRESPCDVLITILQLCTVIREQHLTHRSHLHSKAISTYFIPLHLCEDFLTFKGPQQSRKAPKAQPAAEQLSSPIRFDPRALLNPKAAKAGSQTASATAKNMDEFNATAEQANGDGVLDPQIGQSAFLERNFNLTERAAQAPRKRKVEVADDGEFDEDGNKKNKGPIGPITSGSDLLKTDHKKEDAETAPIDLTNEDDEDDELTITGEVRGAEDREVCLGMLNSKAMVWQIPPFPKAQENKLGKEFWPQMRINIQRPSSKVNSIIELWAKAGPNVTKNVRFGNMDGQLAAVLTPLMDGSHINKMRLKVVLESFRRQPGEYSGLRTSRCLNITVTVYAPRKRAMLIGRHLSQRQQFLNNPRYVDPSVPYENPHHPKPLGTVGQYGPPGLKKPLGSQPSYVINRTQEEILRETTSMFDSLVKTENIPEMESRSPVITTELMTHQKQALHFLTEHEHTDWANADDNDRSAFSLWKSRITPKRGEVWYNIITGTEVSKRPDPACGGILADVMGLGKTLSILALVANTMQEARAFGQKEAPVNAVDLKRNSKATLIICPKSVMANWEDQIRTHTLAGKLKVYSYHGTNRTKDVDELASHHIVLAPYQTAAAEFTDTMGKRDALASINWFRVVLDEAHQIRNPTTHVSKACCKLSAERRWAVTGTPVQNRLDDLGALIKFLRIKPFDEGNSWNQYIIAPFKNNTDPNVLANLRLLVDSITLRRLKDRIDLKQRSEHVVRLDFSDEEMAIYSQFAKSSGAQFRLMVSDGNRLKGKSYAHVLKSIGRMRAICAHGREMLSEDDQKELEGMTAGTAIDLGDEPTDAPDESFITEKHAYETYEMMCDSDVNVCNACGERKIGARSDNGDADVVESSDDSASSDDSSTTVSDEDEDSETLGYLTPCFHLLCVFCKPKFVENTKANLTEDHYCKCPICYQNIRWGLYELTQDGYKAMLTARSKKRKGGAKWDDTTYTGPSTKVKALIESLKESAHETAALPAEEPPIRSVVFSGWTTYLDLIEHALEEHDIGHVRLDGSMSVKARSAVLQTFASDPTVVVLLVSIKAGGQGLNFTMANKVYMMEPQFNPGVETQAIDRVHRLGQKRDVEISRYIMNDSIEDGILKMQERKMKLADLSLERKLSKGEEATNRINELRELFK